MQTWDGELKIIGRVKETIVLLGGENVEPVPIEDTILESEYIDQVMVVGQDQKFLAALVIPNDEAIEKHAAKHGVSYVTREDLLESPPILELISDEINSRVCSKRGFREFERVFRFRLIPSTSRRAWSSARSSRSRGTSSAGSTPRRSRRSCQVGADRPLLTP